MALGGRGEDTRDSMRPDVSRRAADLALGARAVRDDLEAGQAGDVKTVAVGVGFLGGVGLMWAQVDQDLGGVVLTFADTNRRLGRVEHQLDQRPGRDKRRLIAGHGNL